MTSRTLLTRAIRAAVLGAAMVVLLAPLPARAASAVQIEARALVAGRYEVGGWLALSVSLANEGEPTSGYLVAETSIGTVRRFVEMPAGARKVVMLYVQPEAFQREVAVTYDEPNGAVSAKVDVRVLEQSNDQVVVVGDGTGALRPQLIGDGELSGPEPIALGPSDIPERPEPLGGLAAIVWAGDSSELNEAQRRAVERWVGEGGQLVVVGGGDWQARTAGFADLLPLENLAAVDGVSQDAFAAFSGEAEAPVATATVSTGDLRDGAAELIAADDGEVLVSMRPIGAGRVIFVGTDMATDEFRGWSGATRLWSRLLPTNAALEQFFGGQFPVRQEMENAMSGALSTLPALDVPPAELLLVVIVAYILLIGPISYFVLRRIDRRELAWVTAPILVVLFTACSYGIGRTMKGGDVVVNEISVIRTTSEGGSATVDTFSGIVSPDRSTYDLTVEADALIGQLQRQDGLPRAGERRGDRPGRARPPSWPDDPGLRLRGRPCDRHRRARGRTVRRVEHERRDRSSGPSRTPPTPRSRTSRTSAWSAASGSATSRRAPAPSSSCRARTSTARRRPTRSMDSAVSRPAMSSSDSSRCAAR